MSDFFEITGTMLALLSPLFVLFVLVAGYELAHEWLRLAYHVTVCP